MSDRFERLVQYGKFLKGISEADVKVKSEMILVKEEMEKELGLELSLKERKYDEYVRMLKMFSFNEIIVSDVQKDLFDLYWSIKNSRSKCITYHYTRGTGATTSALSLVHTFPKIKLIVGSKEMKDQLLRCRGDLPYFNPKLIMTVNEVRQYDKWFQPHYSQCEYTLIVDGNKAISDVLDHHHRLKVNIIELKGHYSNDLAARTTKIINHIQKMSEKSELIREFVKEFERKTNKNLEDLGFDLALYLHDRVEEKWDELKEL